MVTNSEQRRDTLYASLMGEIKLRVEAITVNLRRVEADRNAPTAFADAESCFLQIRFICELIALSALVANEAGGLNKWLRKDWNAESIFNGLSEINEFCFPHPVVVAQSPTGRTTVKSPPGKFLNRQGLRKIYSRCGDLLHRGKFNQAGHGFARNYDLNEMWSWVRELTKLLENHATLVLPERTVLIVHLFGGPNKEVEVWRTRLPE